MAGLGVARTAVLLASTLVVLACSGDDAATPTTTTDEPVTAETTSTTTSIPERPASTTTTAFDPASIEGQVEAAYLRSWDVYADAVYNLDLDEAALAEVYAGEGLANVIADVRSREADNRAAHVEVDHDYRVVISDPETASVIDEITNHQVLIDLTTKLPIEDDPNEPQFLNSVMKRIDGVWRVTLIQRFES